MHTVPSVQSMIPRAEKALISAGLIITSFGLAAISGDESQFVAAGLLALVLNFKVSPVHSRW